MQMIESIRASTDARDAIPIALIVATAVIDVLWNLHTGIAFAPITVALAPMVALLTVAAFCIAVRPHARIAEAVLFIALWWIYGVFAGQLSYLGVALDYPLRDAQLAKFDAALGFDWRMWCEFANYREWFRDAQAVAYGSYFWQPLLAAAIFAIYHRGRNREMLTGLIIAATVIIAIGSFLPALGPGKAYGIQAPWYSVVAALQSGSHEPLPIIGVITFPSLHAAAAVLFALAHRGIKWSFAPGLALNLLMLVSLPLDGNHYLVDVLGGTLVGLFSFYAARVLLAGVERVFSSSPQLPAGQPQSATAD